MSRRNTNFSETGQRSLNNYGSYPYDNPNQNYQSPPYYQNNQYNYNTMPDQYKYDPAMGGMDGMGNMPPIKDMKTINYVNRWNQQQLYQQQMYLEQQNQQIVQLLAQQEQLKRELEEQKMAQKRDKYRQEYINRELEREALELLDDYEQINGLNTHKFGYNQHRQFGKNVNPMSRSVPMVSRSIFADQAANNIYPDKPQQPNMTDFFVMMLMNDRLKEKNNQPQENKASQILLSSLDKQNRVLEKLTGTMGVDRAKGYGRDAADMVDEIRKVEAQNSEIERLLGKKQLEINSRNDDVPDPMKLLEIQLGKNAKNFLPMINNNGFMSPQANPQPFIPPRYMMGPYGPIPVGPPNPYSMNPLLMTPQHLKDTEDLIRQKLELERLLISQKKKEKKKQNKLKELIKLLGLEDVDKEELKQAQKVDITTPEPEPVPTELPVFDDVRRKTVKQKTTKDDTKEKEEAERKRQRARRRAILWTRMYPILYELDFIARKHKERAAFKENMIDLIDGGNQACMSWLEPGIKKTLDQILAKPKTDFTLISEKRPFKEKDLNNRMTELHKIMRSFVDALASQSKENKIPIEVLDFLGSITLNNKFPPDEYLTQYELNHIHFTTYGAIKNNTPEKTQMLIGFHLFLRIVVNELLNSLIPEKTPVNLIKTLKCAVSILLYVLVDSFRGKLVEAKGNQDHLDMNFKTRPKKMPYMFTAGYDLADIPDDDKPKNDDIEKEIKGIYPREMLAQYFQKANLFNELRTDLIGWMMQVQDSVFKRRENMHAQWLNTKGKDITI